MPDGTTSDDVSNKEKFLSALLALMEARIKAEREFDARPEAEKEYPNRFTIDEVLGSFDFNFGLAAVAPELWSIREGIRSLAKAAPRYFEDLDEIHEMESAFCDILGKKGISEQWTLGVFNAAFDGCGFRKGGTWYA